MLPRPATAPTSRFLRRIERRGLARSGRFDLALFFAVASTAAACAGSGARPLDQRVSLINQTGQAICVAITANSELYGGDIIDPEIRSGERATITFPRQASEVQVFDCSRVRPGETPNKDSVGELLATKLLSPGEIWVVGDTGSAFAEAMGRWSDRDFAGAEQLLRKAVRAAPSRKLHVYLAALLGDMGRHEESADHLDLARRIARTDSEPFLSTNAELLDSQWAQLRLAAAAGEAASVERAADEAYRRELKTPSSEVPAEQLEAEYGVHLMTSGHLDAGRQHIRSALAKGVLRDTQAAVYIASAVASIDTDMKLAMEILQQLWKARIVRDKEESRSLDLDDTGRAERVVPSRSKVGNVPTEGAAQDRSELPLVPRELARVALMFAGLSRRLNESTFPELLERALRDVAERSGYEVIFLSSSAKSSVLSVDETARLVNRGAKEASLPLIALTLLGDDQFARRGPDPSWLPDPRSRIEWAVYVRALQNGEAAKGLCEAIRRRTDARLEGVVEEVSIAELLLAKLAGTAHRYDSTCKGAVNGP